MSTLPDHWGLIATMLAVSRHGSLSGAARALSLSQPTVRRQIEALEAVLGVVLFTRGPAGLVLNPAGAAVLQHAEAMEVAAAAFVRGAAADAQAVAGVVRLTCSDVHSVEVIPPILAPLLARHPDLVIELSPSNLTQNLLQRAADIAVRFVRPTQGALVARKVAPVALGLFAAPTLFATRPPPADFAALAADYPFISYDRNDAIIRGLTALGLPLPARSVLRTDSDLAQLAAIRAGLGIGICQSKLGEASGLVPVLPGLIPPMECWVVMHEDLRGLRRVRVVFDHLVRALG